MKTDAVVATAKTETYEQMRKRHQKEVNALPVYFPFTDEQFKYMCVRLGVNDPKEEICEIDCLCGVCLAKDRPRIFGTFARHAAERNAAMNDEGFAVAAIMDAAADLEYACSLDGDGKIAERFGWPTDGNGASSVILWDEIPNGGFLRRCYERGIREYAKGVVA